MRKLLISEQNKKDVEKFKELSVGIMNYYEVKIESVILDSSVLNHIILPGAELVRDSALKGVNRFNDNKVRAMLIAFKDTIYYLGSYIEMIGGWKDIDMDTPIPSERYEVLKDKKLRRAFAGTMREYYIYLEELKIKLEEIYKYLEFRVRDTAKSKSLGDMVKPAARAAGESI